MKKTNHIQQVAKLNERKMQAGKNYEDKSRNLLRDNVKKKISTTMIGSIAVMEEVFGHLWGHADGGPSSPEEQEFFNMFMEFRSDVMRIGNDNIRSFSDEIERYSVVWNKYQMNLKVLKKNEEGQEDE